MSEHQTYEFLAIDRPLSAREQKALRKVSSRAEISDSRFFNEYDWGDLRADPAALLLKYFDAHLYLANWGTRRLMLRLPRGAIALKEARQYCVSDVASAEQSRDHLVLDFCVDTEGEDPWEESVPSLDALAGLREELLGGDRRLLYLAWLLCAQGDDELSPSNGPEVPAGLSELSRPQRQFVRLFKIDGELLRDAIGMTASVPSARSSTKLPGKARLAEMIEQATVDARDESEQALGWFTKLEENLALPFGARILGGEVQVVKLDLRGDRLVAVCSRGRERQAIDVAELPRPAPRPAGWEWVEAYRAWLGEQ